MVAAMGSGAIRARSRRRGWGLAAPEDTSPGGCHGASFALHTLPLPASAPLCRPESGVAARRLMHPTAGGIPMPFCPSLLTTEVDVRTIISPVPGSDRRRVGSR